MDESTFMPMLLASERSDRRQLETMSLLEHLAGDWELVAETTRNGLPLRKFRSNKRKINVTIVSFDESTWYVEGRKDGEKDPIVSERRFDCSEDAELYLIGLTHKYN
jgi:hypothetical protein